VPMAKREEMPQTRRDSNREARPLSSFCSRALVRLARRNIREGSQDHPGHDLRQRVCLSRFNNC